jgi:regulator of sigma E protease
MSFFLTVVAFVVIFSILVLIHEWGHFIVARKSGIKVMEFGFGLPPRIWGVKKGGTLFSINAIPFGGFVKLLGEDSRDARVEKNPHSFINKPPRIRIFVVLAGVIMNFLLAFVLLTFGFIFGMQPLILSADDVLGGIQNGTIQIDEGVTVKDVKNGGAAEIAGMLPGDKILSVGGRPVFSADDLQSTIDNTKNSTVIFQVWRPNAGVKFLNLKAGEKGGLGFDPYELIFLPRLVVQDVAPGVDVVSGSLKPGDIILKINGKDIYMYDDFNSALLEAKEATIVLWRDNAVSTVVIDFPVVQRVVISDVFPGTAAEKVGFMSGDIIVSVNGQEVTLPEDVVNLTKSNPKRDLVYDIRRGNDEKHLTVQPDKNGLIGVGLSIIYPYQNQELCVYPKDQPTTVVKINDVRYPFWVAPFKAVDESWRLSGLTVDMFFNVIKSFFTRFTIPEGVAGPVGIAQLTYTFVQQGILSLIRFMALLSLSLAIINVLPIPALDGGRLFFILVEVIVGRKMSGRWEAVIHTLGFVLLMVLIIAVTYSDLLKLF